MRPLIRPPLARTHAQFVWMFSIGQLGLFWWMGGVFGNPWPLLSSAMLAVAVLLPARTASWYLACTASALLLAVGLSAAFLR